MKITDNISMAELTAMALAGYGDLVKADVDVAKKIVIFDMEMHADGEAELLKAGSQQADLWGINLYPGKHQTDGFIEFDSMINLKPNINLTRDIDDESIRTQIADIISRVVHD